MVLSAVYYAYLQTGPLRPGHCFGLYLCLFTRFTTRLWEQRRHHILQALALSFYLPGKLSKEQKARTSIPHHVFALLKPSAKDKNTEQERNASSPPPKVRFLFMPTYIRARIVIETPAKICNDIHCLILDSFSWLNSE